MSWVFVAVVVVRIIWWVARSDIAGGQPISIETPPPETDFPQRPQLGGYGMTSPESDV